MAVKYTFEYIWVYVGRNAFSSVCNKTSFDRHCTHSRSTHWRCRSQCTRAAGTTVSARIERAAGSGRRHRRRALRGRCCPSSRWWLLHGKRWVIKMVPCSVCWWYMYLHGAPDRLTYDSYWPLHRKCMVLAKVIPQYRASDRTTGTMVAMMATADKHTRNRIETVAENMMMTRTQNLQLSDFQKRQREDSTPCCRLYKRQWLTDD